MRGGGVRNRASSLSLTVACGRFETQQTKRWQGSSPNLGWEWGLGVERGGRTPKDPTEADTLAALDVITTGSQKAQQTSGKPVSQGRHAADTTSKSQRLEAACPPGPDERPGGGEKDQGLRLGSPQGSLQEAGVTTRKHARPTDSLRCHTRGRVRGHAKPFMGIEKHVAVRRPWFDATDDVDTRHGRICPRAFEQVNQHRPLPYANIVHARVTWDPSPSLERGTFHGGD